MTGLVELWRTPRGTWHWRWHDASGASILANQSWDRIEEAHEAASRAYPGEVVVLLEAPPGAPHLPARGRLARSLTIAAAIVLLVGIVILLARRSFRTRGARKPTR